MTGEKSERTNQERAKRLKEKWTPEYYEQQKAKYAKIAPDYLPILEQLAKEAGIDTDKKGE